jgi:hypothetical protein
MKIVVREDGLTGEQWFGLIREDGSSLWTTDASKVHEIETFVAEGNTATEWQPEA